MKQNMMKRSTAIGRNSSKNGSTITLLEYMDSIINQLYSTNRYGTAINYQKSYNSFKTFIGNRRVLLKDLNDELIEGYNNFLIVRGLTRNSVSFYMRILRSIYNKASKQGIKVSPYPFYNVYIGVDRTRKRAVESIVIAKLATLSLPEDNPLIVSRDLFLFSYYTRGMSFIDIAYLLKSNICNGTLYYTRHKTGQQMVVKIEPPTRRIMERYITTTSRYIFPIIKSHTPQGCYLDYLTALNRYNRHLGILSKMLGCSSKLTSYTPRHSWATAAKRQHIPIAVISQGMGHTSEHTTQIYLDSLSNSVIDRANHKIISELHKLF